MCRKEPLFRLITQLPGGDQDDRNIRVSDPVFPVTKNRIKLIRKQDHEESN